MKATSRLHVRGASGRPRRRPQLLVAGVIAALALTMVTVPQAGADTPTAPTAPTVVTATTSTSQPGTTPVTSGTPATAPLSTTTTTQPTTSVPAGPSRGSVTITPLATSQLNGVGSSFAAPAIETFASTVKQAPYSLNVNYTSSSSGDGRFEFANNTTNYAASDIAYGLGSTDTTPPTFPFIYVPVTAGGIAFMYRIDGLTKTLQLSSYTACAILTGGITNWDSPQLAADNPGVTFPNLTIRPVTESDAAGTNYVLEEWCIEQQPALWAAFANQQNSQSGGPGDGVVISPTAPESNWPGLPGGLDQQSTSGVAGNVATNNGAIGAVQVKYATDLGFGPTTPAKGVAAVKNASGDYTQPTPVDVASALAYATQQSNGTHKLNFAGTGPNVYNPSTYSYLLVKTTGSDPALGAVLSGFVNYALTLGQTASPTFGYASLGLSLEQYGIDQVKANVPGAVAPTAAEQNGYSCGDLTPTEVQKGQTTPTCGVVNTAAQAGATTSTTTAAQAAAAKAAAAAAAGGSSGSAGSGSSGSGGSGSGADPSVALSGSTPLAFTGGNPFPLIGAGLVLIIGAWIVRRRSLRRPIAEGGGE
jgi:ABC-type phosphate transport system substrate-binding protein